ncbi:MAG: hypothetical protein D6B25_20155 [Desulfobulbaceae bacterium]|nr:MAG: hypothetical protein D6B25_20155 [Desulfobulbaceae bacterium]
MEREFSFTLTVPQEEESAADRFLAETRKRYPGVRVSRKPDRKNCARYYISFPQLGSRPDLSFQQECLTAGGASWELFGPNHGRWGLV